MHSSSRSLARWLSAALFGLAAMPAAADPTIRFELPDGTTVSDVATIVARAVSPDDAGIDKVEFMVDGQLAATDTSTPYSFDWDTLSTTEGEHVISATAFDAKGRTATARITLRVDNELAKGADFHAQGALAALKGGDPDRAAKLARRALKIAPDNLLAARALAGIHRQRRELAQAIAVLEKASIPESDADARAELAALYIAHAAEAPSTGAFLELAGKAVEQHRSVLAVRQAAVAPSGDPAADALRLGDARFAARNWVGALAAYQKCGLGDDAPIHCANRVLLAYIQNGRIRDALSFVGTLTRRRGADEVTRALHALVLLNDHQPAKARDMVQDGIASDVLPSLIVASYADLALRDRRRAREEADRAARIAPDLPEVLLLRAFVQADPIDAQKLVLRALEKDPLFAEAYAVRDFQMMGGQGSRRFAIAGQFLEFALKIDPKSGYALMGTALALMAQRRPHEAEPLLAQLMVQEPNAPDALVAMATCQSLLGRTLRINDLLARALKIDPERWNDALVPEPVDLIRRVYLYRHPHFVSPAALYPRPVAAQR